jgi:hypothetical protein
MVRGYSVNSYFIIVRSFGLPDCSLLPHREWMASQTPTTWFHADNAARKGGSLGMLKDSNASPISMYFIAIPFQICPSYQWIQSLLLDAGWKFCSWTSEMPIPRTPTSPLTMHANQLHLTYNWQQDSSTRAECNKEN